IETIGVIGVFTDKLNCTILSQFLDVAKITVCIPLVLNVCVPMVTLSVAQIVLVIDFSQLLLIIV
ncbi:MAG: hypothetical protein KA457_03020, partial [Chitinophagales bacterium]|nr:hypothetical protein [Chitinophagales bacterium]